MAAPASDSRPNIKPMDVKQRVTSSLKPYKTNPRRISEAAVDKVAASLKEFGFRQPIVVDKSGVIIAGHTRWQAAMKLGMESVPVHEADTLTRDQVKAYRLADNRTGEEASWDDDLLTGELEGLNGFDLSLTGFDQSELTALLSPGEGHTDEDAAPEAPTDPITKLGDVWRCGAHRVLCGDATNADDVAALLAGVEPVLMVTDPPYGYEYDPAWRERALPDRAGGRAVGIVNNDDNADWREAWALFPGDIAYVWHAPTKGHIVTESLTVSGFELRSQIIWAKNSLVIGRGHYHPKHEPCLYVVRKGGKGHWRGGRKQSTVWDIDRPMKSETGHSTQKPVECMRRPMENNSAPGDAVYDPFLGSGTTMIAAETTGRVCLGIEIDPAYVDVIVNRWQDFTGETATRESDG